MNVLCFLLAINFLGFASSKEDNVAEESEYSYRKWKPRVHAETEESGFRPEDFGSHAGSPTKHLPVRDHVERKDLAVREREARGEHKAQKEILGKENSNDVLRGPIYVLSSEYGVGKQKKEISDYYERPKHSYKLIPVKENPELEQEVGSFSQNTREQSTKHAPYASGSYLSHIRENMINGKLLGFASFVEHFSENDDAEELKTAMQEGSLDDIKKLVPKSGISFQMYHEEMEERPVKEEAWNDVKPWGTNRENVRSRYVKAIPHKTVIIADGRKRVRNRPERHYATLADVEPEYSAPSVGETDASQESKPNEIYTEEANPQIIPSISYEIPSRSYKAERESVAKKTEETHTSYRGYGGGSEQTSWKPLGEKPKAENQVTLTAEYHSRVTSPKPPEVSKLYFEHFTNSHPQKFVKGEAHHHKISGLSERVIPDRGSEIKSSKTERFVGEQRTEKFLPRYVQKFAELKSTPERSAYEVIKKPIRIHPIPQLPTKKLTSPAITPEVEITRGFVQTPRETIRLTSPGPTKYQLLPQHWAKQAEGETDHFRQSVRSEQPEKAKSPVTKLERILNKQLPSQTGSNRGQEARQNENIFLTKEFQNEISEFLNGGKSDFEWVPSTHISYDEIPYGSSPTLYLLEPKGEFSPTAASDLKSRKLSTRKPGFRSERNLVPDPGAKSVVFLEPEPQRNRKEFFVSASYKIDKNPRSEKAR